MATAVLGKGSAAPALTDKLLFITTTTCPYAQRTWIALGEAGIEYDTVYVDLDNKPEWLFAFNPLGKVPTIVRQTASGTQHAYESLILNELIDEMVRRKSGWAQAQGEWIPVHLAPGLAACSRTQCNLAGCGRRRPGSPAAPAGTAAICCITPQPLAPS